MAIGRLLGWMRGWLSQAPRRVDLPEALWRDMTHVGPEGRQRLTEAFGHALAETPPAAPRTP